MNRLPPNSKEHPNWKDRNNGGFFGMIYNTRVRLGLHGDSEYSVYHEYTGEAKLAVVRMYDWRTVASMSQEEAEKMDADGKLDEWIESEIAIDLLKSS